jgi:hypothetical protein
MRRPAKKAVIWFPSNGSWVNMIAKNDLEKLAQLRIDDAIILLNAGRASSAYYLAGYSVELALKACISKLFQKGVIPDKQFVSSIYTHKFENLISLAGLKPNLDAEIKMNSQFAIFWAIATKWSEESRYELWDTVSAVSLVQAIHDPSNGVLKWVKQHW